MTYSEKLKDPRWQKKRLEVMEAAGFKCQMCWNEDKTLHIHHVNYRKGAKPWEYELHDLKCLCEECHEGVEKTILQARRLCSSIDYDFMSLVCIYVQEAYNDAVMNGETQQLDRLFKRALAYVQAQHITDKLSKSEFAVAAYLSGDLHNSQASPETPTP